MAQASNKALIGGIGGIIDFSCVDYKNFDVYEVTLERPTTSFWYRRTVYYTVYFKTNNGDFINRDTKALWSDAVMSLFGVAEYGNAKVKIAYNEDKDKLTVLGR